MSALKTCLVIWRRRSAENFQNPTWLQKAANWGFFTALFVRVCWVLAVPVIPISDSDAYDVFAQNIADGYGFCWTPGNPTAYWAVGTSAIYAFFYWSFGHSYTPIVILNVVVGLGSIVLSMSLARRWLGPVPAVITGWVLAVWPLMIQFTTILASELLFNFFVLLAFWVAGLPGRKWIPRAIATGIALAAAVYIRPVALLLAPVIFLPGVITKERFLRAITSCTVAYLVMMALILPWSMRNMNVFDRFVLVSTNAGSNFWMGNNPQSSGLYMELPETGLLNEVDRDKYFNGEAWKYIRQEPLAFMTRTLHKSILMHDRESIGVAWNEKGLEQRFGSGVLLPLKLLSNLYWWVALAFAGCGAILLIRQKIRPQLVTLTPLAAWFYYTAVHSITVAGDRYHVPSIPFIAMLVAYAISVAIMKDANRKFSRTFPS